MLYELHVIDTGYRHVGLWAGSPPAQSPQVYLLWQSPVLLNTYDILSLFQVVNRTDTALLWRVEIVLGILLCERT